MRFVRFQIDKRQRNERERCKPSKQNGRSKRNGRPFATFRVNAKRAKMYTLKRNVDGAFDPNLRLGPKPNGDVNEPCG